MPATRISADGKTVKTFGLEGTRYLSHAVIWDFAPTPDGGVYLLIFYRLRDEHGYRLLGFDSNGKLTSDHSIEAPFDPQQIAVLGNGDLVVAGRKTTELGGHKGDPGIAIINSRGQLVRGLSSNMIFRIPSLREAAKLKKPIKRAHHPPNRMTTRKKNTTTPSI